MNSDLLGMLGFDPAYIIIGMAAVIIILFIMIIVALSKIGKLNKKYASFMRGQDGKTLEKTLIKRLDQIDELAALTEKNKNDIKVLFDKQVNDIQKYGIVKYDAFDEMGGRLSFSLALLNQEDSGVVLNAVHTREGCYIYIKDIIKGESVILLTEEEKGAIEQAINGGGLK
ncbi:MAG: DUF4446 family protein [Eubacterium sp.]|nr:DUF4446 family protein [Eubacterium sp.]